MESGGVAGAGGGSGGGPAPFLLKTYEMVDDASTDDIVSWSSKKNSFVVWNPPEFARVLLPTYFKHNNFSSFIRQLNTYGFRKTDPERWEFTNEDFVKDQKNLLKNIHRRKPIHSHSHPQGSLPEAEKAALDEEIEKLTKEKNTLQTDLWRFRHHQTGTKAQLDNLEEKVHDMEQRQLRLMNFLARAIHNPNFVEHLIGMASDTSIDFLALNKKRRLPKVNLIQEDVETSFVDNSSSNSKSDFGNVCHRDFFNKLKLELSPAVSDSNLLAPSAQSSNEDGGSQDKKTSGGNQKDGNIRAEGLLFVAETFDVSDTGASFALRNDRPFSKQVRDTNLDSMDECDAYVPCHLNLTLASSALQDDSSHHSSAKVNLFTSGELRSSANDKEPDHKTVSKNFTSNDLTKSTSPEAALINNQGHGPGQGRVNDMFWEQFLTEKPGSSDTEDAISTFRANNNSYEDQEEGNGQNGKSWKSRTDMKQLTL